MVQCGWQVDTVRIRAGIGENIIWNNKCLAIRSLYDCHFRRFCNVAIWSFLCPCRCSFRQTSERYHHHPKANKCTMCVVCMCSLVVTFGTEMVHWLMLVQYVFHINFMWFRLRALFAHNMHATTAKWKIKWCYHSEGHDQIHKHFIYWISLQKCCIPNMTEKRKFDRFDFSDGILIAVIYFDDEIKLWLTTHNRRQTIMQETIARSWKCSSKVFRPPSEGCENHVQID